MMLERLAALFMLILATSCAIEPHSSLGHSVIWNRTLVSGVYQIPQAMIRTSDGGYAIAGYGTVELVPGGTGVGTGFWTVRLDREGKVMWQRAFAAERPKRDEEAATLVETRSGGLLVVGTTHTDSLAGRPLGNTTDPRSASTSQIGFVVCYGPDGTLLWTRGLNSPQPEPYDRIYAVATANTGYIIAGTTKMTYPDSLTPSGKDSARVLRVLKLNDNGEVIWDRTVPENEFSIRENSVSRTIARTDDGGFVIAIGPADEHYKNARKMEIVSDEGKVLGEAPYQRIVLIKLNAEGQVEKRSEIAAATGHLALGANSNGYIVSGYANMLWYAFFDTDLNQRWKKTVIEANSINAFLPAPDGGFYGVGSTSRLAVLHISPSGELRQQAIAGMPGDTEGRAVVSGDRPDEMVVLWSRIVRTNAGLTKLRVPAQ